MAAHLAKLSTGCLGLGQAPVAAPRTGESSESSFVEIARSLDLAQERLDVVEAHRARCSSGTPLADLHQQDLRAIQLEVAQLAAALLGADHPFVAQLVNHEWSREVVAPAKSTRVPGPSVRASIAPSNASSASSMDRHEIVLQGKDEGFEAGVDAEFG
jgi:hypothetical protein